LADTDTISGDGTVIEQLVHALTLHNPKKLLHLLSLFFFHHFSDDFYACRIKKRKKDAAIITPLIPVLAAFM
jgi:hypothetical protein